jgi:hypothetical protein
MQSSPNNSAGSCSAHLFKPQLNALDVGAAQVGAEVEVGVGGQDFGAGAEAARLAAPRTENRRPAVSP